MSEFVIDSTSTFSSSFFTAASSSHFFSSFSNVFISFVFCESQLHYLSFSGSGKGISSKVVWVSKDSLHNTEYLRCNISRKKLINPLLNFISLHKLGFPISLQIFKQHCLFIYLFQDNAHWWTCTAVHVNVPDSSPGAHFHLSSIKQVEVTITLTKSIQ